MPKVTGIVKIYVNGSIQRSKPGASLMFGGKDRTAVKGHRLYGPAEAFRESEIEMTIAHMADTDEKALNDMVDATVEFESDTGPSWVITNAFTTEPGKLTGGEGDLAYTIQGDEAEKK